VSLDSPGQDGSQKFNFRLPDAPFSYLGAFSSLFWAVELVVLPTQECAQATFSLSPAGHPILLAPLPVNWQRGSWWRPQILVVADARRLWFHCLVQKRKNDEKDK
jgi:hypothetical protein